MIKPNIKQKGGCAISLNHEGIGFPRTVPMNKLILTIVGIIGFGYSCFSGVTPEYQKHDKIKGSTQILVNTEEFVESRLLEEREITNSSIANIETNISLEVDSKIEQVALDGTNHTISATTLNPEYGEDGSLKGYILGTQEGKKLQPMGDYSLNEDVTRRIGVICDILKDTIGSDTNKTIRAISAEEVAKIVLEAPESYDTLQEIAEWILNDTTGAAQMANDIAEMKTSKADKSEIEDVKKELKKYVDDSLVDFDVYGQASNTAINVVQDILRPTPMEVRYDGSGETYITNAFICPDWAVSPMKFTNISLDEETIEATICLYGSTQLRNYSVLVEEIPDGTPWLIFNFDSLKDTHRIYATPKFDPFDGTTESYELGWVLTTNDVPCVISLREPEEGVLLVKRDKVEGN